MKNKRKRRQHLLLCLAFLFIFQVSVRASSQDRTNVELPQIVSWDEEHGYLENGELLRNGWGYDTVNPAGKYVLFDENGTVLQRRESMESEVKENYTGTELTPGIIALRTAVFEGFAGTIEVIIEEQNGVAESVTLTSDNFYEWNLSRNSGVYRILSAVATDENNVYTVKFSSEFQSLLENGLSVMQLEVTSEIEGAVTKEDNLKPELTQTPESDITSGNIPLDEDVEDKQSKDMNLSQEVRDIQRQRNKAILAILSIGALVWAIGGVLLWHKRKK